MELQALLVLCGVGVVGVAVVLLMGLFSASGTSYEEAIAQQRRATNELLALADNKNKSKKTNKKANKKLAKKEKRESASAATGSEIDSEAPVESGVDDDSVPSKPHVEFNPAVDVEVPSETPNIKIRKRGKDPKVKPILLNKEDPSCVSDPSAAATPVSELTNNFEEMHPKDEFELLQSSLDKLAERKEEVSEKKETKTNKQSKSKTQKQTEPVKEEPARELKSSNGDVPLEQRKAKKVEKKAEVSSEEVVPPLNPPQPSELTTEKLLKQVQAASAPLAATAPAPSPPPKNKKKKTEQNVLAMIAGEGGGVAVGELVRVVREAALSRTEIQILTDALLNKHHDPLPQHSDWTEGPNDPMQRMKKQLADKEKALADEIEASQGLHVKLKELRASLNAERARAAAAGRAAEGAASAARAEMHSLQTRLQRSIDENHALAQDKLVLQAKSKDEAESQAQRLQLEKHVQRLTESEAALVSQLSALQEHAADLTQQLQESSRAYSSMEAQCAAALLEQRLTEQELRDLILRHLDANELKQEICHLNKRAQTAETTYEQMKEESEKDKQELSKEIASLREQLSERESEAAELKQLKATPAHNGLPPTSATDEQKAAELAKVESVVEALRNELSSAQKSSGEQRDQLTALQAQLNAYKDKNNDLRTKNWKIMEALQNAEKSISSSAMSAGDLAEAVAKARERHFVEAAKALSRAHPAAAPECAPGEAWLTAFADNLKRDLERTVAERERAEREFSSRLAEKDDERERLASELSKILREKESETERSARDLARGGEGEGEGEASGDGDDHLRALVDKYRRIIDDTEGALCVLQTHVSREERRWARRLHDQQRELDALRDHALTDHALTDHALTDHTLPDHTLRDHTLRQMQTKIESLEAELQKCRSEPRTDSFADAERLAEERLVAGLCSKRDAGVPNGPLQLSL